jgi:hypothetical protein
VDDAAGTRRSLACPRSASWWTTNTWRHQAVRWSPNVTDTVATADTDFGLIPADQTLVIANETDQAITLRHPVADRVLAAVEPAAGAAAKGAAGKAGA